MTMVGVTDAPCVAGRYLVLDAIGAGGMATVHLARQLGAVGFSRTVAVKRLRPELAEDPTFVRGFVEEARLAAHIRHPHVVPTLDVVASDREVFLVMEYVHGESLSRLLRFARERGERPPVDVVIAIVTGVLHGLHAAHQATDERGQRLDIVHRDVSPQNIVVGRDGVARVLDFGIAHSRRSVEPTRGGRIPGKTGYLAPEQLARAPLSPRTDVYAASVVLWECLAGERWPSGLDAASPGRVPSVGAEGLDAILARGLAHDPASRWPTAEAMAVAMERLGATASVSAVGAWVESLARDRLLLRQALLAAREEDSLFEDASAASKGTTAPLDGGRAHRRPVTRARLWPGRVFAMASLLAITAIALARFGGRHTREAPPPISSGPPPAVGVTLAEPAGRNESERLTATSTPTAATKPNRESRGGAARTSAVAPTPRRPPIRATCEPPYVTDGRGHRHYREECF